MKNKFLISITILIFSLILPMTLISAEIRQVECTTDKGCESFGQGYMCDNYLNECVKVPGMQVVEPDFESQPSPQGNDPTALIIGASIIVGLIILGLILRKRNDKEKKSE